jgi:hypothetical protein
MSDYVIHSTADMIGEGIDVGKDARIILRVRYPGLA